MGEPGNCALCAHMDELNTLADSPLLEKLSPIPRDETDRDYVALRRKALARAERTRSEDYDGV